tara:strand:- start:518 stop:1729 length:1212 start_codon:yes stop_codon:yes gene_type:complete
MGRARQIASAENMDRILLDASAASTDEGEHLLLDASAASTDVGFFINTEVGTTETPPEGFVGTSSIAADAIDNTKIADDAVKLENITGDVEILSNRNTVINGAFNVNQRGNQTGAGASSVYLCDRFEIDVDTAARINSTTPAVTDLPDFTKCLKMDVTTADTSVGSGDLFMLRTAFEGQDLQRYKKGTSEAKGWVLSYYMKVDNGPFTGTAALEDAQNDRHVNANFTATSTWQRFSHFFPADSSGTLDNDNTDTLRLVWYFLAGSTYSSGSIQSAWASRSNSNMAPNTSNFMGSTDTNIYITGIQLEAGDTLTKFEAEPVPTTLRKCQRYFHTIQAQRYGGYGSSSAADYATIHFPVTMRATPTMSGVGTGSTAQNICVDFAQSYRVGNYAAWQEDATADIDF